MFEFILLAALCAATPALEQIDTGTPDPSLPIRELTCEDYVRAAAVADSDADGISNLDDTCPTVPDPGQVDSDGDGVGDLCDECPAEPAPGWTDGCPGESWP